MTFAAPLHDSGTQHHRLKHLHHGFGYDLIAAHRLRDGTVIACVVATAENGNVAFSAVKHHAFFQHRHALELLQLPDRVAGLKCAGDIEFRIHRVEAAVKLNRLYPDIGAGNFRTLDADIVGLRNQLFPDSGQEYAGILKTVSVTAGVQNSSGLDPISFPCRKRSALPGKSVISHKIGSSLQY